MFELDLLTQRGSLIKHDQINEIELSCSHFFCFTLQETPVIRKCFNLANTKLFPDFTKCLHNQLSGNT